MSLLMDALRKAEESKQRNASLNAEQEGAETQPLAVHANAASFAIKPVDTENSRAKLDSAAHNIDIENYSSVQSASSEKGLNAQHWGMLFDKSASHKTAWMTTSDLEEETKTLLEWDDSLASTLFPQKSSEIKTAADSTGTAFTDFTEIPTHATKATALNLDLSGLTDDAVSLDSNTGTLSATYLTTDLTTTDLTSDVPFLDLSGLIGQPERDEKLSLDLTGLEDVTDAESEAQAAATIDGILLQDDTSTLETALQAEAEKLSLDEDSVLQMEQALNDIDPSELDWQLASDALEKQAESVAIQQDDDSPVDWSAVSIETVEQTGASTPLDEFSEGMGAAESAEPNVPILDLELPDYTHSSAHSEEMPVVEVAQPDNALNVPTLDLNLSDMNMSAATMSAGGIGTNAGLDWGDVLSESNTPVSPEELQQAWGEANPKVEPATLNVDAPTPSVAESLELEWDDALLPLPENAVLPKLSSAAAQPEAQKQQAAQDLLKATKRRQRHMAKFNAYSLLGLISIAVLGFVLLYTLKDPNKPLIDNNAPQLSTVEPASNLPSPSIAKLTEPETPISTPTPSTPVVSPNKTLPPATNASPSVVAADKPAAPLLMSSGVDKAAAEVTALPDDLASKRTELASDAVSKTVSNTNTNTAAPVKNNTPASAKTQVAIAPPEKLLSYPNTSLRQNLPDVPETKTQKPVNENVQVPPDIQRNRQQEQRTQQLNRSLNQAYQAFQNRQWSQAQALYQTALQQDAYNRDALLGLASIALMQGNPPQAQQYYQTVLKHHPQDQTARLGMLSATANTQPANGERALRTLLNEDNVNKGYVYFSLGSLYAGQHRWSAAQEAFFNAWRQDKQQPNYAYNLAVSLEHLNQPAAAIPYYQQALQLAQSNPSQSPNFNLQTVQQRLQTLLTQLPSQQRELTQFLGQ